MSPNRVGGRAHEIHDTERDVHGVRGANASDGFRQEPARGYGVHLRVRYTMKKTLKRGWSRRRHDEK